MGMISKEVKEKILLLKKKLLGLRIKLSNGELKDTSEIEKTRKEIARLFTNNKVEDK